MVLNSLPPLLRERPSLLLPREREGEALEPLLLLPRFTVPELLFLFVLPLRTVPRLVLLPLFLSTVPRLVLPRFLSTVPLSVVLLLRVTLGR